ncbi:hypothetical protein NRB14_07355 [Pseudomonas viridiflava]|uniref:hypothetical protein n=1 Tax=Pseudomonas viridiflava TaxID=33069 RepID=UPI00211D8D7D|nr:hypothetical protein [Pseudomonas viridiflava]MCQ9391411.1 hypothetical protein [Pseudomonas viridiflava]
MKFDCVKFAGKVDYVRSVNTINGGHKILVSIDGAVIPNLQVSNKLYEELEAGENATLYGIFNRSKKKEKNHGVLYGLSQRGEQIFDTSQRFKVPVAMTGFAVIAFCAMFVIGWVPSLFALGLLFGPNPDVFSNATVLAVVEGSLAALFFLWRAQVMLSATANPESWESIEPATLSSRFSKFHK